MCYDTLLMYCCIYLITTFRSIHVLILKKEEVAIAIELVYQLIAKLQTYFNPAQVS